MIRKQKLFDPLDSSFGTFQMVAIILLAISIVGLVVLLPVMTMFRAINASRGRKEWEDGAQQAFQDFIGKRPRYFDFHYSATNPISTSITCTALAFDGERIYVLSAKHPGYAFAVDWDDIRGWRWELPGYQTEHVSFVGASTAGFAAGMAASMGANRRNEEAKNESAAQSGFFIDVADVDTPELHYQSDDVDHLKRWMEIFRQIKESGVTPTVSSSETDEGEAEMAKPLAPLPGSPLPPASAPKSRGGATWKAVAIVGLLIFGGFSVALISQHQEQAAREEAASRAETLRRDADSRAAAEAAKRRAAFSKAGLNASMIGTYRCIANPAADAGFRLVHGDDTFSLSVPPSVMQYPITQLPDGLFTWSPGKRDAQFKIIDNNIVFPYALGKDCVSYGRGIEVAAGPTAPPPVAAAHTGPAAVPPATAIAVVSDDVAIKALPGAYACESARDNKRRIAVVNGKLMWQGSNDFLLKYSNGLLSIARDNMNFVPVAKYDYTNRAVLPLSPSDFNNCRRLIQID
jgi:hypothetical protein